MPEAMKAEGANIPLRLLGVSAGAFIVLVVTFATAPRDCRSHDDWRGAVTWACVVVGALSAFVAPVAAARSEGGWRVFGSLVGGIILTAFWLFGAFVLGIYFAARAGCFD